MPSTSTTSAVASLSERGGSRWLFGLGADRALPLRSILIGGDVFAERYSGDTRPVDWTAEVAVRRQMTPRTILESAVGRRFTGLTPAWFVSAGVSSTISARLLIPEARGRTR
jgi:hypothetical protein